MKLLRSLSLPLLLLVLLSGACQFRPDVEEWQPWTQPRSPELVVSRQALQAFGPDSDGMVRFPGAPMEIRNEGNGNLHYTMSCGVPWLRVVDGEPYGVLPAGGARDLRLEVVMAELPEGLEEAFGVVQVRNSITLTEVGSFLVQWRRRPIVGGAGG